MSKLLSRRRLFGTALAATSVGAASLMAADSAFALCGVPHEQGLWLNAGTSPRGIRHVRLRFSCQDVILNGRRQPSWYMTVFGVCSPRDCEWGEAPARKPAITILRALRTPRCESPRACASPPKRHARGAPQQRVPRRAAADGAGRVLPPRRLSADARSVFSSCQG